MDESLPKSLDHLAGYDQFLRNHETSDASLLLFKEGQQIMTAGKKRCRLF